jgi:hypothetical protein
LADHRGRRAAAGVGLDPHRLVLGEDGDVGLSEQRLDGKRAGVALGPQQAGITAAGLALDAGGDVRARLVELDPQRQVERPPALAAPVGLQPGDRRIVGHRRIGVGRLVALLGRIDAALAVHLPMGLRFGIVGGEVSEPDRPGRRDAAGVLHLIEVALAQPHQGGAVEARVAADEVIAVGRERVAVLVPPLVLGAVAVLDEHRLRIPVLRLARQVRPALQDEDLLAGRRQSLGQRRATGAGAHDDHVEMFVHGVSL